MRTVSKAYITTLELPQKYDKEKYLNKIEDEIDKVLRRYLPKGSPICTTILDEEDFKQVEENSPFILSVLF